MTEAERALVDRVANEANGIGTPDGLKLPPVPKDLDALLALVRRLDAENERMRAESIGADEHPTYDSRRRYCGRTCSTKMAWSEAMANVRRGADTERKCVIELTARGYAATRSAASKGRFDVIGVSGSEILLIQVKRTKNRRAEYSKEVALLKEVPVPNNACVKKQLWVWRDRDGWTITTI